MKPSKTNLRKNDARRVLTAEMWLGMGKPLQALIELQRLNWHAWRHPWSEQVLWRAVQSLS